MPHAAVVEDVVTVVVVEGRVGGSRALAEHLGTTAGVAVVGTASTPAGAVDLVRARIPRVVLLDLHGLGATALDLVRRLGQLVPPPTVVVLAGHLTVAEHEALRAAGVRTVLFKQIDSRTLVGAVRDAGAPSGLPCA